MLFCYRIVLAFIFFTSTTFGRLDKVQAAGFGQRAVHQLRPFDASEIKFIAEFSSYLKYTLLYQGLELKKKIYCLGFEEMSNFYTLKSDDIKLSEKARQSLEEYKSSVECESFLKEVESINLTFKEMRVMLALHQSRDDEIKSKLINGHSGSGFSNSMSHEDIFMCDQLVLPLKVEETDDFCLEDLISIVNIFPQHIVTTDSALPLFDYFLKDSQTPEVANLQPLTWPETVHAAIKFQEKFIGGEFTYYLSTRDPPPKFENHLDEEEFYRGNLNEYKINKYGESYLRYLEAREFQAQGRRYFSDYPENSAPTEYIKSLSKYPFLIFIEPEKKDTELDCETDWLANSDLNIKNFCIKYLQSLSDNGIKPFDLLITEESVANALNTSLKINSNLLEGLNNKYPLNHLLDGNEKLKKSMSYQSLADWSSLLKMRKVTDQLFTLYGELKGAEARFVEILDEREFNKMALSLVGAVGFGLSCSFIGNIWGLAVCLAASGFGVNVAFYAQAYNTYEENFGMFFARDTTDKGELMTLLEFSKLNSSLQDLYLETMFLGIGTGAKDIVTRSIKRIR